LPQFKTTRRVAVPPEIAFAVASDVASYKEFLPLLERSVIRGTPTELDNRKTFNAELAVGYAKLNLREAFISKVVCDGNIKTVSATSSDAPFKDMKTVWSITDANGQSDVTISIHYSMRSMLMQFALAGAMDMAVSKIMTAFEARAKSVQMQSKTS
jgi:coenzyme Q-binding protein COQ10